jgi:hypothetical protein
VTSRSRVRNLTSTAGLELEVCAAPCRTWKGPPGVQKGAGAPLVADAPQEDRVVPARIEVLEDIAQGGPDDSSPVRGHAVLGSQP